MLNKMGFKPFILIEFEFLQIILQRGNEKLKI